MMMTAQDVVAARFRPTRLLTGFDQREVDDFLDRVTASLRVLEEGAPVDEPLVTADEVATADFSTVLIREGYDRHEVETFLQEVTDTLRELEHS